MDKRERGGSAEVSINVGDEVQRGEATGSTEDAFTDLQKMMDLQNLPPSFWFAAAIAVFSIVVFRVAYLENEVGRIKQQIDSRDQIIQGLENKSTNYLSKTFELHVKIYELTAGLAHTKMEISETKSEKLEKHMRLHQRKLAEGETKHQHEMEMVEITNQLKEQCRSEKDQLRENSKEATEAKNRQIQDLLGVINEMKEKCHSEELQVQLRENSKEERQAEMTRAALEESLFQKRKTDWLIECLRKQGHIFDSLTFPGIISGVWKAFARGLGISSDLDNCLKMSSSRYQ